jgi:uncharacterized protein (DUF111 family)
VQKSFEIRAFELEEKEYDIAYPIFKEVLSATQKYEERISSIYGMALCQANLNMRDDAIRNLKLSISILESARGRLPVPELKTGMLSDKLGLYNLLISILLDKYRESGDHKCVDSAFNYIEKSKAAALTEMLSSSRHPEVEKRINEITVRISDQQKSLILGNAHIEEAQNIIAKLSDSLMLVSCPRNIFTKSLDLLQD